MLIRLVEEEVLERVKPRPQDYEKIERAYSIVKEKLVETLKAEGVEAEVSLQGSVAKDTWLRGDVDLDVFVLYPPELGVEWLRSKGYRIIKKSLKGLPLIERFAEHPFVTVRINGVEVDVVPAFRYRDVLEVRTAVDRTPFHTRYVKSRLTEEGRDQARLLKAFMKGIGVYGAEIKVRGFSGYLAELLVIAYGGFREVLENAARWRRPIIIDVEKHYSSPRAAAKRLGPSPIIVVDPVDPGRNAAAAVSEKRLAEFVIASRAFLSAPSLRFFFPEPRNPGRDEVIELSKTSPPLILVYAEPGASLPPDILWGEIWRNARRLESLLENYGFKPVEVDAWSDGEIVVWGIVLEAAELSPYELVRGPPFDNYRHSRAFLDKYSSGSPRRPWADWEGRLRTVRPRRYRDARSLLEDKWSEYMVAPHLRVKPRLMGVEEAYEVLRLRGGLDWLARLLEGGFRWE